MTILLNGVRIEIVINVDPVYVIAASHVSKDGEDVFDGSRITRIEPEEFVVADEKFRMSPGNVISGRAARTDKSAAGVEPCVEFDTAIVGFFDPDCEGIPWRLRCRALRAGQILAPWFDAGRVERISGSADLEDDGIEFEFGSGVEELADFGALCGRRKVAGRRPVDVVEGGDPCSAKFTRRRWRCVGLGARGGGGGEEKADGSQEKGESHGREWRMANGEWRMANREWGMGNGEWGMGNGRRVSVGGMMSALEEVCWKIYAIPGNENAGY
jgi:hypothetical protein